MKRESGAGEIIRRAILRARVNVNVKYSEVRLCGLRVKCQRSHFFAPANDRSSYEIKWQTRSPFFRNIFATLSGLHFSLGNVLKAISE